MKLKEIQIKNWKCFTNKVVHFDDNVNLLKWPNGSGKSSLIECIIFAITDKRPAGLDFDSLRNNLEEDCEIVLSFDHALSNYTIERSFGKASQYRLFKDGELISRSRADNKLIMDKIIPEVVVSGLWGYNSLALSSVLKTDYLFEILENEFDEPLRLKKYFQTERTFNQKNISAIEKTIFNQDITQKDLDNLNEEIDTIQAKLKSKAFISDAEVIKAKQCEKDYPTYLALKEELSNLTFELDRELCLRLTSSYKARTEKDWLDYFDNVEKEIQQEKFKATTIHPLAKYPKNVVDAINKESIQSDKCIVCGSRHYKPVKINYDLVDSRKIERLETILKDRRYNFIDLSKSVKYFQTKHRLAQVSYVEDIDWRTILDKYNAETNQLYQTLEQKQREKERLKTTLGKITELLAFKQAYDNAKKCIDIIDNYVTEAKAYYSSNITKHATTILKTINPRYDRIFIENGVYKVIVHDVDFNTQSVLAVQSLSNGEKTITALSLILTMKDLFMKDCPLIMDEAFVNLDATNIESINTILENDQSQWIIVSHDERMYA